MFRFAQYSTALSVLISSSFIALAQEPAQETSTTPLTKTLESVMDDNGWSPDSDNETLPPPQIKVLKKEPTLREQIVTKGLSIGEATAAQNNENVPKEFLNQTLKKTSRALNTTIESAVSSSDSEAKARISYDVNTDGVVSGTGDVFMPFENTDGSVNFIQTGATAKATNHWIGTLGAGRRWNADSKNKDHAPWMFGYNTFFEHDLFLNKNRASAGVEVGRSGLLISSNGYVTLNNPDAYYVSKQASTGWDIRAKGTPTSNPYLTFTGAYSIWDGAINPSQTSDKTATQIWSYGVEYKPLPLITTSLGQKVDNQGAINTETRLSFTYRFGIPLSQKTKEWYALGSETPSFRQDFVNRDNLLIHLTPEQPDNESSSLSTPAQQGYDLVSQTEEEKEDDKLEKLFGDVQIFLNKPEEKTSQTLIGK